MTLATITVHVSSPNDETLALIVRSIRSINHTGEPIRTIVHGQTTPFGSAPFNASHSLVWGTPIQEESATIRVSSSNSGATAPFMDWLQHVLRTLFAHPEWDAIAKNRIARGEPTTFIALPSSK